MVVASPKRKARSMVQDLRALYHRMIDCGMSVFFSLAALGIIWPCRASRSGRLKAHRISIGSPLQALPYRPTKVHSIAKLFLHHMIVPFTWRVSVHVL